MGSASYPAKKGMDLINAEIKEEPRASTKVYERIREEILSGRLKGGAVLVEQDIAKRLGVSRTPVREALRRLGSEGLLKIEPRRRAQVARITKEDTDQIFSIRAQLEVLAAECAAVIASEDNIATLQLLAGEMEAIAGNLGSEGIRGFVGANEKFHREILSAASNPWLEKSLGPVLDLSLGPINKLTHNYSGSEESAVAGFLARNCRQHREIIEAICARDPAWANAAMQTHVRSSHHDWGGKLAD